MDDHREGIQIDKPLQPWERPGCFRLDCEPHRAEVLSGLSIAGLIVSQVSMCLPFLLILGMPFNIAIWFLARHDLAKMKKGLMDPTGQKVTAESKRTAGFAFVISIIWAVSWAMFLFLLG